MHDLFKTPEQKKKEDRQALFIIVFIFSVPILFILIMSLLTNGDSSRSTSSSSGGTQCSTRTEPYSGIEHEVDCEDIYNRYGGYDDYSDNDWKDNEYEYEMRKMDEELERLDTEYWDNYCNENPYECI